MAGRGRHVGRLIVLATVSALLTVLGVEGGLRLVSRLRAPHLLPGMPWMMSDIIVGHRNIPGFSDPKRGIAIDGLGLRGPEVAIPKPPGVVRILCLGDSTTFGVWRNGVLDVRFTTSYPSELERVLHERGRRDVEVVNGGVMGYTTAHALRLLVTKLRAVAPDVITIRLGNNDHTLLDVQPWWLSGATPYDLLWSLPPWAFDWQIVRVGVDAYQRLTVPPAAATPTYKVPLPELERNLERLVESATRLGARTLFLDFPYRPIEQGPWLGEELPNFATEARSLEELHAIHARYQAVVQRFAHERGLPFVETASALRSDPLPTFTDYDNSHPNAEGLRVIGGRLADALVDLGWLDTRGERSR